MKVIMPICYTEEYIPPRCRKPRTREIKATVMATIAEASQEAAPIAFVVHDYERYLCYTDIEVRKFKGKLYRKRYNFDEYCIGFGDPRLFTVEELVRHMECYRYPYATPRSKDEATKAARDFAKPYLIINGEVWHTCGEPMYCIYTFGLGHNHASTSLSIAWCYNPNIGNDRYFSALEKDKAIDNGVRIALRRGDTDSVDRIKNPTIDIKVMMPEAVKRRPHKDHGAGCEVLNSFEEVVEGADSAFEAGLLVTMLARR